MKEPRICVVGSSNMDLLAKIPRLPAMGETLVGRSFHMGCGGKGANQAVMAAKMGAHATMVTKLGRDPLGEMMFKNYEEEGIDTQYVFFDEQLSSGAASILVDDQGRNMIVIVPGANDALSPDDARRAGGAISTADAVICQLEIPLETTVEAFRIAKEGGALTVFNPAPGRPLPEELLALSDVVVPNETEAEIITGMPVKSPAEVEAAAAQLKNRGARAAIITLGERGAVLVDDDGGAHVPGHAVCAVDTTGAGDAFVGSLAYFLARGIALREAVRHAHAVAAEAVMNVGAQTSFSGRRDTNVASKKTEGSFS